MGWVAKLAIAKKQVLLGYIINPTLNSEQVCVPGTTLTGSASENPAKKLQMTMIMMFHFPKSVISVDSQS